MGSEGSGSDLLDGMLARKTGPTIYGAIIDPLCDKLFFFVNYEYWPQKNTTALQLSTMPTELERAALARLPAPESIGAVYMLYAFESQADRLGVMPDEIVVLFDSVFRLDALQRGNDRGGHGSAWYTLIKREA